MTQQPSTTSARNDDLASAFWLAAFLIILFAVTGAISICGAVDVFVGALDGTVIALSLLCVWLFGPPLVHDYFGSDKPFSSGAFTLRAGIVTVWTIMATGSVVRLLGAEFSYGKPMRGAIFLCLMALAALLHDLAMARIEGKSSWYRIRVTSYIGLGGLIGGGIIAALISGFHDFACR